MRRVGASVGGSGARALPRNVPPGWGEPVFDRLEADFAEGHAQPACLER